MTYSLPELGFSAHFQSQLEAEEFETHTPLRVIEVQRNLIHTLGEGGLVTLPVNRALAEARVTVGDWVLATGDPLHATRVLDRKSDIKRRAAGEVAEPQSIAANIDTLFIVTSCNQDFNIARLERYLVVARQAGIDPVVVLTKTDLADSPSDYRQRVERNLKGVMVETLNATSSEPMRKLAPWLGKGQAVALVGSSGVGKTTLTNALTGRALATQDIRADDDEGRHTTTARSMYPLPTGAWLIDTPGMRELQVYDVAEGVEAVFSDIVDLAADCRFSDCKHETEPGCAVLHAIEQGQLDARRLERWRKLEREDAFNTSSVAERRARSRQLGRMYAVGKENLKKKRGDFM